MDYISLSRQNMCTARHIIAASDVCRIWREAAGAEVRLVGSLAMGLMMKHRDIDLHIYTDTLDPCTSFAAVAQLSSNCAFGRIECRNLAHTDEECIEWHAEYCHTDGEMWQIDMIHIRRGSRWDGYFERVAERIAAVLTPAQRDTILRLKYETPETEHIPGIEYCRAVIDAGVDSWQKFSAWRSLHPADGIVEWMP